MMTSHPRHVPQTYLHFFQPADPDPSTLKISLTCCLTQKLGKKLKHSE